MSNDLWWKSIILIADARLLHTSASTLQTLSHEQGDNTRLSNTVSSEGEGGDRLTNRHWTDILNFGVAYA